MEITFTKQKYVNIITELMKGLKDELITVKQFIVFIIRLKNEYLTINNKTLNKL